MEKKETKECALEREAFEVILPELIDIIHEHNLSVDSIVFAPLVGRSSVYFMSAASFVCAIRIRKETRYVAIPEQYESLLPFATEISRTKSDTGLVRIPLESPQDILLYKEAIRASLRDVISKFHTFDCCGRYEQCSDKKRCVHPDPTVSVGCWYKKNLLAGRIFYGKNKNIP